MIFGGQNLAKVNQNSGILTDLWSLDLQFVPQELNQTELSKKKELTGAVWTQIEYKLKFVSPNSADGYLTLDYSKATTYFSKARCPILHRINQQEVLLSIIT